MTQKKKNRTQYAQRIFDLRKQNKVSQKELAQKIGLSENGFIKSLREETFQVKYLEQIAQIFGVSMNYFFEEEPVAYGKAKTFQEFLESKSSPDHELSAVQDEAKPYKKENGTYEDLYFYRLHLELDAIKKSIKQVEHELALVK